MTADRHARKILFKSMGGLGEGHKCTDSGARTPADVYIPGWANGRDAALDVTVVSSLQKELRKGEAAEAGSAAARR